jgi:hypothetical protein
MEEIKDSEKDFRGTIYIYEIKCRRCGGLSEFVFGQKEYITLEQFSRWYYEHMTFPMIQDCTPCNKKTVQDIVSVKE